MRKNAGTDFDGKYAVILGADMKDLKIKNGNKLRFCLAVSVACLILYTVPAWTLGIAVAVLVATVLAVAIYKIPGMDGWLDEIKKHPCTNAVAFLIVWLLALISLICGWIPVM